MVKPEPYASERFTYTWTNASAPRIFTVGALERVKKPTDIALIFRKFNLRTLEGLEVYSMVPFKSPLARVEAVHMYLDILNLQNITSVAQFCPSYQLARMVALAVT